MPETRDLVALAQVVSPRIRIIISGEHKQLGPIIHSSDALAAGLTISFMKRSQIPCFTNAGLITVATVYRIESGSLEMLE